MRVKRRKPPERSPRRARQASRASRRGSARRRVRPPSAPRYRIHPYDHPERWLCIKTGGIAYLVELNHFGLGRHACSCDWFEFHKWDGPPIKPCVHIRRVLARLLRVRRRH